MSTSSPGSMHSVLGHVYVATPDPDAGFQLRLPDISPKLVTWAASMDEVPVLARHVVQLWLEEVADTFASSPVARPRRSKPPIVSLSKPTFARPAGCWSTPTRRRRRHRRP
jgi:hypothetical protein